MSLKDEAKGVLARRALAYQRVFLTKGKDTDDVLADLATFCRASETTFHADPRLSDVLNGRREVFLRISHFLKLTEDQLWSLYGNKSLPED
ncbi:MAG: hypothetical protein AAB946_00235 [Patescibacteria group bacterium]